MSTQSIREIGSIEFGVLSADDIRRLSVCEVNSVKLSGEGSVYDERMGGNILHNTSCKSCKQLPKECPGHFGHIELNVDLIHPLFVKRVVTFLRCFCHECHRLLVTRDQLELNDVLELKGKDRFQAISKRLEKIDSCCHPTCQHPHPKIAYSIQDHVITMMHRGAESKEKKNASVVMTIGDIRRVLDPIPDEDVRLCGFNPDRMHPRNLILSVFPVIPPCSRPFVVVNGNICDDDLTNQLIEIVKANNILKKDRDTIPNEKEKAKRDRARQTLEFKIQTFYNNSHGKAKHPTNGRPIKGIKERLTGKGGQIRNNLMGKRVEFSARTVIGPDPNLRFGDVGIPPQVAAELTVPEVVNSRNRSRLLDIINSDKANFLITTNANGMKVRINLAYSLHRKGTPLKYGDVIIREGKRIDVINSHFQLIPGDQLERDGKVVENLEYPQRRYVKLKNGDVVHRQLQDDDLVLLNRQPTLHKGSMLAKRVKVRKGKTFRMNLATTKTYNADFDGDEMNIHVPQSLEAKAELALLSSTKHNIISAQGSKPNIAIVQDSLMAAFLMTKENDTLTKGQFFDICMHGSLKGQSMYQPRRIAAVKRVLKMKGKPPVVFNGRGLVSLLLPEDFNYEKKNGATEEEPVVRIHRGVLYEGVLNKQILGASHNSLIQVLTKEYGVDVAADFISNIQFITNNWLLVRGFSVGLQDCLVSDPKSKTQIQDAIAKCYVEAEGITKSTHNPGIREVRLAGVLNKAKDIGMKIAKDALVPTNNFLTTVHSGSKGDFFNIAQLTGLLGQQNLTGQRITPELNHGKRTLVHYPFEGLSKPVQYESRGFVGSSFIEGLNPREFYFHAMSGREGICDTAMGTAKSGYIQRRIVKLCEDIQVRYDGTVRDANGEIYQMSYGQTGLDPTTTVKVNGIQQACDVGRLAERLNTQEEIRREEGVRPSPVGATSIAQVSGAPPVSRIKLLKRLHAKTGKKRLYKGKTIAELQAMLRR